MPQLPDRQRQRRSDILLGLPDRQAIALELRLVGGKIHHVAVAGAQ